VLFFLFLFVFVFYSKNIVVDRHKNQKFDRGNEIDRLIYYLWFYVPLRSFSLMETSPLPVKGCLCLALRAFEQGDISIVPHLLWHGTSVFPVSSEGPHHLVSSYDKQGNTEDLFLPWSSRVKAIRKRYAKGCYIDYHTGVLMSILITIYCTLFVNKFPLYSWFNLNVHTL
jgi:hypothetical protein